MTSQPPDAHAATGLHRNCRSYAYYFVTVTQHEFEAERRCRWCGVRFKAPKGPGRPQQYCRTSHRQRAYEARKTASAYQLGPDDILIDQATFQRLRDLLYQLEAALDDVDADLGDAGANGDFEAAFEHLRTATLDVRGLGFEPRAIG